MSLEQLIAENTAALKELTTVMRSGNTAGSEVAGGAKTETKATAKVRYFHIPKHNTVAEVKPGDVVPTLESTTEISKADYDKLKKQYAEPKADAVPFTKLTERVTVLSKIPEGGREEIKALLTKYLPKAEKPKFPELEALGKNAEILVDIDAAIAKLEAAKTTPEAAAEDDLGL